MNPSSSSRRRLVGPVIASGLVGCIAMALSMGASLSGFTASITNPTNTASSGALQVTETATLNAGSGTCTSSSGTSASCSTINLYGGSTLAPGVSSTSVVTFAATGSTLGVSSGSLTPGTCSAASTGGTGSTTPSSTNTDPTNLCSQVNVKVYAGATATGSPIYNGTAAAFTAAQTLGAWTVASGQAYTFVLTLSASAPASIQGQTITQSLAWVFSS